MYASTFIFRAGQYDGEFHRLDRQIADMARATPGYLGEDQSTKRLADEAALIPRRSAIAHRLREGERQKGAELQREQELQRKADGE